MKLSNVFNNIHNSEFEFSEETTYNRTLEDVKKGNRAKFYFRQWSVREVNKIAIIVFVLKNYHPEN